MTRGANGGTWQAIYHYESVSDGGGGFYYELQGTDYTADLSYSEYTYQQGEKLIEVDCGGTVTVGENAYVRTAYTHYYNAPTGTGGGGAAVTRIPSPMMSRMPRISFSVAAHCLAGRRMLG